MLCFAADMHLRPGRDDARHAALSAFLDGPARAAGRLVLLGDVFHCWFERRGRFVGEYDAVLRIFRAAVADGLRIEFLPGNRDFAAGAVLAGTTGMRIWGDGAVLDDDVSVLCMHGDRLCVADRGYMALRRMLRGPLGRCVMATTPWRLAKRIVGRIQRGPLRTGAPVEPRRDIRPDVAAAALSESGARLLVCGHIHVGRDAEIDLPDRVARLVVCPPWCDAGEWGELRNGAFSIRRPDGMLATEASHA